VFVLNKKIIHMLSSQKISDIKPEKSGIIKIRLHSIAVLCKNFNWGCHPI
jgi:hypothetical protein